MDSSVAWGLNKISACSMYFAATTLDFIQFDCCRSKSHLFEPVNFQQYYLVEFPSETNILAVCQM